MAMKLDEIKIPLPWVITIIGFVASASIATYEFITVEERLGEKIESVDKKIDQLIELYNSQHGINDTVRD